MSDRGTRLYSCWQNMKGRCRNKNRADYSYYGGKGVVVCDEWQEFAPFKEWALNSGYSDSLTLDRIDGDGNYHPSNCRWATRKEQRANQKIYVNAKLNPEKAAKIRSDDRPHPEIAKDFGVSRSMVTMVKLGVCWSE